MSIKLQGFVPLLQVFDMAASVAFYCDVLGFELVETSKPSRPLHWALLRQASSELMLNAAYEEQERPANRDPSRQAAHADVALFFGCHDLDAAFQALRAKGLDVKPPVVRDYGMNQIYFKDLDGYQICLQRSA
jgi:catechol 2,3-dioxygenase-like lactoylglutathione lyase family enzyme